ncbi:hypothetical protein J0A67_14755 [Algoriphagus aestuariicola]|jgi:hypothetical protein|uniref:Uncharacterized protein n=1 Tax=Algoriphagus aestuariicola TaxID=1852016 RepID=A0ABS3BV19_9BACT|nr:hypothetical protein [Algoriphagus aestuariicola]MBN7802131.1 hypothetical protein [Algoriphagus aestuariicola]
MKTRETHSNLFQQRFTLLMALLLCLFVSGIEYLPQEASAEQTEHSEDHPDQTFLNVAVDAVVPFVLHVAHTVLHLIYQVFSFELKLPLAPAVAAIAPNNLVEILFERIISPQGP